LQQRVPFAEIMLTNLSEMSRVAAGVHEVRENSLLQPRLAIVRQAL
jgi:hypothetical protein